MNNIHWVLAPLGHLLLRNGNRGIAELFWFKNDEWQIAELLCKNSQFPEISKSSKTSILAQDIFLRQSSKAVWNWHQASSFTALVRNRRALPRSVSGANFLSEQCQKTWLAVSEVGVCKTRVFKRNKTPFLFFVGSFLVRLVEVATKCFKMFKNCAVRPRGTAHWLYVQYTHMGSAQQLSVSLRNFILHQGTRNIRSSLSSVWLCHDEHILRPTNSWKPWSPSEGAHSSHRITMEFPR